MVAAVFQLMIAILSQEEAPKIGMKELLLQFVCQSWQDRLRRTWAFPKIGMKELLLQFVCQSWQVRFASTWDLGLSTWDLGLSTL